MEACTPCDRWEDEAGWTPALQCRVAKGHCVSDQNGTNDTDAGTLMSPPAPVDAPSPAVRRGPTHPTARAAYLARVTRSLSGALHTDRAVDLVLEMLVEEVADWAQVVLRGRRDFSVRSRTGQGSPQVAVLPLTALTPGSVLGRVLATGHTDLVPVYEEAESVEDTLSSVAPVPRIRESLAMIRPMDVLTVALSARGSTYGTLTLARRAGEGFDADAVAFLEELADRVSITLDTTRALADSRRVASVLARDLNPPDLPKVDGVSFASYYRVAIEQEALGGDFYDVHGDADDWTAVVGDVCGKGVDAAVLTGRVRQSVRTAAIVDRSPAKVLDLTNRVLVAEGKETFVTALCARGRRTADGLHLDLASAGHPRPWVVRRDGSVEQVDVTGLVLGLLEEGNYTEVGIDLAPGETLVLYTDGVPGGARQARALRRRAAARRARRLGCRRRRRRGRGDRGRAVGPPRRPPARRHRDPGDPAGSRRMSDGGSEGADASERQDWESLLADYLDALGSGDRSRALGVVRGLRGDGVDVLSIVTRLLAPAQRRVGELWVRDAWSVAQEHAATAISESALHVLAAEREQDLRRGGTPDAPLVVVSCVEQEWHALPALIVAEHLRDAGYAVSYLGANASAQHLVRHIHELGPRAVLLSCSISAFLPLARRQVEAVRETGTPVVVGGSAFDAAGRRARAIGATAFAGSGPEAAELIAALPSVHRPGADEGTYRVLCVREGHGAVDLLSSRTASPAACRRASSLPASDSANMPRPSWPPARRAGTAETAA